MSVSAIHLWTCDICGAQTAQVERTSPWSDPVVMPPDGWMCDFPVPTEHRARPTWDVCDACPACQKQPDWSKYSATRG